MSMNVLIHPVVVNSVTQIIQSEEVHRLWTQRYYLLCKFQYLINFRYYLLLDLYQFETRDFIARLAIIRPRFIRHAIYYFTVLMYYFTLSVLVPGFWTFSLMYQSG